MGAGYRITAKADTAEVFIYEDVGGWFGGVTAKTFADDLKAVGAVSQIDLRINSYGGEVFDGLAIYNQLKEHSARVVAHIDGIAASIASVIAMAGDDIIIAEAGFMMIHNAQGVGIGDATDLRRTADTLDTVTGSIADVYVARTGRTQGEVRDLMTAETWFTGQEAVDGGFANSMVDNMRMAAHAELSDKHKFQHIPTALIGKVPLRPTAEITAARQITGAEREQLAVIVQAVRPGEPGDRERLAGARQQLQKMRATLTLAR